MILSPFMIMIVSIIIFVAILNVMQRVIRDIFASGRGHSPMDRMVDLVRELQSVNTQRGTDRQQAPPMASKTTVNTGCPNCGATVENMNDISPNGDVKCNHCGRWYSVHAQ